MNVEDRWFSDPRRSVLVNKIGEEAADGCALKMWRVAQEYYRLETLIPKDIYFEIPHAAEFLASRLAEERKDGVYIKGAKGFFNWGDIYAQD